MNCTHSCLSLHVVLACSLACSHLQVPREVAQSTNAAREVVEAATEEEATEFLWGVMRVRRAWLEVWTERLREWFAARVLQPLVATADAAHAGPNELLAKYGQAVRLPPLPFLLDPTSASASLFASGVASASAARAAGSGDVEMQLRQAQAIATAMAAQAGPAGAASPLAADARRLAEGLIRYEQLLLVLQSRRPSDLLPPAPPGYLWSRLRQLAQGSCVAAYNWNGGGAWAGRPWSPDLPNDSVVLLYAFAAFIDAPGWEFAGPSAASSGGLLGSFDGGGGGLGAGAGPPLFLGAVRTSRPPPRYSAILAYRLEKPGKGVDALFVLNQGGGGGAASGAAGGGGGAGGMAAGGGGGGGGGGAAGSAGTGAAAGLLTVPGSSSMFCLLAEGRLLALTGYNVRFGRWPMLGLLNDRNIDGWGRWLLTSGGGV